MQKALKYIFVASLNLTAAYYLIPQDSHAQMSTESAITVIEVQGNQRIDRETIISLLALPARSNPSSAQLDTALKKLFDIGYFADASFQRNGQKLIVQVVENPVINQLAIEGNDKISEELIKGELSLRPRQIYTQTRLKNDAQRIQDIYRLKGHFAAIVTPKIIKRDQNRVDVVFEVQEGEPTVVRKIFFVGNQHFDESKLESTIQTKETRWYRFFSSDDNYDPDRLAFDRELLRKFYLEHGYADFVIKSAVAELSPDRKEFFITFTLEEGERYQIGDMGITSQLKDVDAKTFENKMTLKKGDWYSSKEVERTITRLTDALGVHGFAFVEVKPKLNKNSDTRTVDINLEIQEGPKVYIDKIVILGNERTDEEVLRRELRFYEGDPFNTNNLKISERRLKGLGFFKKIDIKREPSSSADKVNIVIEVEEERTGEIKFGGGYSTTEGLLGDIKFAERNFRGKGNEIQVGLRISKYTQEYDLFYEEPYFFDKELHASMRLFKLTQKKEYDQTFDQKSLGTTVSFGYALTDNIGQNVYYKISQEDISNLNPKTSQYIKAIRGKAVLSAVGQAISYDKRDNRYEPTEGYVLTFSNEFAGLGGDISYLKNKLSASYIYSFSDDVVLRLNGSLGNVMRVGKNIRVSDRFTLGNETFRGFELGGVSPRDRITDESLGGTKYYTGTAEVTFPIGLPNEFNVKGATFVDIGNTFSSGLPAKDVIECNKFRASVGVGVRWRSPMGPIRIDYSILISKHPKDKPQPLLIGFSTTL